MRKTLLLSFCTGCLPSAFSQVDSLWKIDGLRDSLETISAVALANNTQALSDRDDAQQEVVGMLQANKDVFLQFATSQWSMGGFSLRGYRSRERVIGLNGVPLNSSSFSNLHTEALFNAGFFPESRFGISSDQHFYSGLGGYLHFKSTASLYRKGFRFSYGTSNVRFRNKYTLTYTSGNTPGNWSFVASASALLGNQLYVPGTYQQSATLLLSLSKEIHKKQRISFTGFMNRSEQGLSSSCVKEAFQLAGSNYYNPSWGWQNGKIRNASVHKDFHPVLTVLHENRMSPKLHLSTSLCYGFQKTKISGLQYNDASNPRPDHYTRLPSYYYLRGDSVNGDQLTNNWVLGSDRQLDWDRMIRMNQANLYSDANSLYQPNVTETRARYVLENRVTQVHHLGLSAVLELHQQRLHWTAGVSGNYMRTRRNKELADLLGASFWLDVDPYAGSHADEAAQQNNINSPNRRVREGERFGFDYVVRQYNYDAWAQVEYLAKKLELSLSLRSAFSTIQRLGLIANGKFPQQSKGESELLHFFSPAIKGGVTYKLSGRHFVIFHGLIQQRSPQATQVLVSPDTRNQVVDNFQQQTDLSFDVNYSAQFPRFRLRFTCYSTQLNNQVWLRSGWHDAYNTFVTFVMKDVNVRHQGVELGIEKNVLSQHVFAAAISAGQFYYTNRPRLEVWQDNTSEELYHNKPVYLKNFRIGNAPQTVMGAGYRFHAKRRWYLALYWNRIADVFAELNPERRTAVVSEKFLSSESQLAEGLTVQEKLPSYTYFNINGGALWNWNKQKRVVFSISINNLFNNTSHKWSGFEQVRWDAVYQEAFPNKYLYLPGRTYLITLSLSL